MMRILAVAVTGLLLLACQADEDGNTVSAEGIVRYMDLEGGFYGIIADDGEKYLPGNLDAEFRKDSLRISFEGVLTDRVTTAMWGRTIRLTKIQAIP